MSDDFGFFFCIWLIPSMVQNKTSNLFFFTYLHFHNQDNMTIRNSWKLVFAKVFLFERACFHVKGLKNYPSIIFTFQLSSFLGVVWCLSCIAFLFSNDFNIPVFSNPLACGVFYVIFFLNPTKTFHYRARRWLLRILVSEIFFLRRDVTMKWHNHKFVQVFFFFEA